MSKRIGITGASGFIGKLLINKLDSLGYQITALSRSEATFPQNVSVVKGDLLDDKSVKLFLKDSDVVIHLAARQLPPDNLFFRENVEASFNLIKNIVDFPIKHLIYLSTIAVYGDKGIKVITEKDSCNPTSPYGITKYLAENICNYWRTTTKGKLTILRPFNVYGKGSRIGVVYNMLQNVKEGKPINIFGNGKQIRDFLNVEDLLEAIIISLNIQQDGDFNLGSGKETSLLELLALIKKVCPKKVIVTFAENENDKAARIAYSIDKAHTVLGWESKVTLEEGLKNLL
jgi:UDP-glucose 4-epimerase